MRTENKGTFPLVLCAALAAAACGPGRPRAAHHGTPPGSASPEPGSGVGDFTLRDIDGRTHQLSDYLGREVVVLSFFATWCEPCKIELMALRDYYRENRGRGFVVLAVAMDEPETMGDVRLFARGRRLDFPVLLDSQMEASGIFNPKRLAPYVVVINRAPSIYWSRHGYAPGDERRLVSVIEAAVSERLE